MLGKIQEQPENVMPVKIPLTELRVTAAGKIVEFQAGAGMARNLENMGMRIGSRIRKVSQQFARGPVVVSRGRTTVAIGFGMARRIIVET